MDYTLTLDCVHSDSCMKPPEEITAESQSTSSIRGLIFDLKHTIQIGFYLHFGLPRHRVAVRKVIRIDKGYSDLKTKSVIRAIREKCLYYNESPRQGPQGGALQRKVPIGKQH